MDDSSGKFDEIYKTTQAATDLASSAGHTYVTVEHLLLAALATPGGREKLWFWSVNVKRLRSSLERFLSSLDWPQQQGGAHALAAPGTTLGFQRVVSRVRCSQDRKLTCDHLLDAILHEGQGEAVAMLRESGLAIALPQPDEIEAHEGVALAHTGNLSAASLDPLVTWIQSAYQIADEAQRAEKIQQIVNVIRCMQVNALESVLDTFIATLSRVKEENRNALSANLAILALAPDSLAVKEKCLMALAGEGEFGWRPQADREQARAVIAQADRDDGWRQAVNMNRPRG